MTVSSDQFVSVGAVSGIEAARCELRSFDPQRVLINAWDIGKDVHMHYLRTLAGEVLVPPTKVLSLAEGYRTTRDRINVHLLSGRFDLAIFGHEPTGIYHQSLSYHLATDFRAHLTGTLPPLVRYRWLNPALVKEARQRTTLRHRKSDKIDVVAIADLLAEGQGYPAPSLSEAEIELRLTLRYVQNLLQRQRRLNMHILRTLDQLWPGALGNARPYQRTHPELPPLHHLVDSSPLERTRVRLLLQTCPNPYRLRDLGAAGIRQLFIDHGQRCGPVTAERIYAIAQQSLLPSATVCALLADQVQADFLQFCWFEDQIAASEAQASALLPATSGQVLTTLHGMSPRMAARYLAGIGDPDRFASARQIWAYAGFDPTQADSGNHRHTGGISHRGSPFLRATLFQIGHLTALHCPDCIRLYVQARQRGLNYTLATIHVANKANRILFALLKSQQPYRSPLSPEEEALWQRSPDR